MYAFLLERLDGVIVSELAGASGKRFNRAIGTMATAGVTLPLWHDDAEFLLAGDALLRVIDVDERTGERVDVFHGRLVTAEEVATAGAEASVAATFADGFWELTKRLIGKSQDGYSRPATSTATQTIEHIVTTATTEEPLGIVLGATTHTAAGVGYGPVTWKKASDAIAELAAVLDGPDWRVDPIPPTSTANPLRAAYSRLRIAPVIGSILPDQPFEFGGGRLNVASYKRGVNNDLSANRVYHVNDVNALVASSAASIAARGLFEDVVSADLSVDALRTQLLAHHIAIRSGSRQTITFEPVNDLNRDRLPRLCRDYDAGDIVPFRAAVRRGAKLTKRIDVSARIYSVDVSVDAAGVGQPSLTVTPSA